MSLSDNIRNRKKFTAFDVALAFVLICVSVILIVFQNANTSGDRLRAVVKKNGVIVQSFLLDDTSPFEICVDDEYSVVLLAEKDGVSVILSDCTDKICVNTGKITKPAQTIVCLPVRISVELFAENEQNRLDGVTG